MWELLADIITELLEKKQLQAGIQEGSKIANAYKNLKKYRRTITQLNNPSLALKNQLGIKVSKTPYGSKYLQFRQGLNKFSTGELTRFNTDIRELLKNENIRTNVAQELLKRTRQDNTSLKTINIKKNNGLLETFIDLKSSWVEAGMYIPLNVEYIRSNGTTTKDFNGDLYFRTKEGKKDYLIENFPYSHFVLMKFKWITPYGHGAGSFLWKYGYLKRKAVIKTPKPKIKRTLKVKFNQQKKQTKLS